MKRGCAKGTTEVWNLGTFIHAGKNDKEDILMDKKILVVDDELNIVKALVFTLKKQGYTTFEAMDGEATLDMVKKVSPDLILLDVMIPKMDGYEVCRKIRVILKQNIFTIIMLTATRTMEADSITGFECGADGYILKPFSPMEIVLQIKKILE